MTNIFLLLKEAFASDENRDYTTLSINRAVVLLAIPMVVEMFFEALFALVDAFFVSNYVGVLGVATVGLTESVLTIIYSLAWGLSSAATAIVARRIGEKHPDAAYRTIIQLIYLSLFLGLVIGTGGYVWAEKVLQLMGGETDLIDQGKWYTKVSFLSAPVIILLFTLSGAVRGTGNASLAMRAVMLANVLNILLDTLFIPVLHWGVEGAAIATLIGRSFGVAFLLYNLFVKQDYFKHLKNHFAVDFGIIRTIGEVAAGGAGQFIIQSCSWIFLTRILSEYGSEVIAGYTIAIRVIIFTILPSWGMANACATLVGQNLGAGQPQRAETSALRVTIFNTIFLFFVAILLVWQAENIVLNFDTNPAVVAVGKSCLIILSIGYLFFGAGMVLTQALNGAGDTLTPTLLNIVFFWIIEIPLAYVLAINLGWEENGVFYAIIISESLLAVAAYVIFKRGKWKLKEI